MSHDNENDVGRDVWMCAIFVSCSNCAGFFCKFEVVAVELNSSANSKSSMLPLVIDTRPCTNATEKGQFYSVVFILATHLPLVQPHR